MATYGVAVEPGTARHELLARLDNPDTVDGLNRLLDRLDVIVFAAEAADGFLRRSDVVADSLGDSLGDLRNITIPADAHKLGDKLPELARTALQAADLASQPAIQQLLASGLLQRLGSRSTIDSLHELLDHLDLASLALKSVDEFLKRGDVIGDNLAASLGDFKNAESPIDLARVKEFAAAVPVFFDVAMQIKRSGLLEQAQSLMSTVSQLQDSGILGAQTVAVAGEIGVAAATTRSKKEYSAATPKGLFGLLAALKDPDVQASLGFVIALARNYGRVLKASPR